MDALVNNMHTREKFATPEEVFSLKADFFKMYSHMRVEGFEGTDPKFPDLEFGLFETINQLKEFYRMLTDECLEKIPNANHPSAKSNYRQLHILLADIDSIDDSLEIRNEIVRRNLGPTIFTMDSFAQTCEKALDECLDVFEGICSELKNGTNKFTNVLTEDFDMDNFHKKAIRAMAYLCHLVDKYEVQLNSMNDIDPEAYDAQVEQEVLELQHKIRFEHDRLTYLRSLMGTISIAIAPNQFSKQLNFNREDDRKLNDLAPTLNLMEFYRAGVSTRYGLVALEVKEDKIIEQVDIFIAALALMDYFKLYPNKESPKVDIRNDISIKTHIAMLLGMPDDVLTYLIELDQYNELFGLQKNAPLKEIMAMFADQQSTTFAHFCVLVLESHKSRLVIPTSSPDPRDKPIAFINTMADLADQQAKRYLYEIQPGFIGPVLPPSLFMGPN